MLAVPQWSNATSPAGEGKLAKMMKNKLFHSHDVVIACMVSMDFV